MCDALVQFADGSFSAIVDKGGLDALMGEDTQGADEAGAKLLAEVARLLEPCRGSVYFCVTLAQSHVLSEFTHDTQAPRLHMLCGMLILPKPPESGCFCLLHSV